MTMYLHLSSNEHKVLIFRILVNDIKNNLFKMKNFSRCSD